MTRAQGAAMMFSRFTRLLSCGAAAAMFGAVAAISQTAAVSTAQADDNVVKLARKGAKAQQISLGLDKSMVLELPADAYDILVANPEVADAVSRTARRIYLFGKDIGDTNIFVFGKNGEQIANLNLLVDRDISGLQANLAKYIEDSDIKVEIVNNNVILAGTVQTAADSARAEALANVFMNGGGASAS